MEDTFLSILFLITSLNIKAQTIRDKSGFKKGTVENNGTVRDKNGFKTATIKDGVVRDKSGFKIGTAKGVSKKKAAYLFYF